MGASASLTAPPPQELIDVLTSLSSRPQAIDVAAAELRAMDVDSYDVFFNLFSSKTTQTRIARTLIMDLGRYPLHAHLQTSVGCIRDKACYVRCCCDATTLHVDYRGDHGFCWLERHGRKDVLRFQFNAKGEVVYDA